MPRPGGDGPCPHGCSHPVAGNETVDYHEEHVPLRSPRVMEINGETIVQEYRVERYQECIVCGWRVDL